VRRRDSLRLMVGGAIVVPGLLIGIGNRVAAREVRVAGRSMGTTFQLRVFDSQASESAHYAVVNEVLTRVDRYMSTYKAKSEIGGLNRAPADHDVLLSTETAHVLSRAMDASRVSDGAFDPTVGPLVDRWGFGPLTKGGMPSADELRRLAESVGATSLAVGASGRHARKCRGETRVDLSGIAKGYAVDQVCDTLHAAGEHSFLFELGGEVRVVGSPPDGDVWRIGIEHPSQASAAPYQRLAIRDLAVATSGSYRNFRQWNGRRYCHSIDPRTGYPVVHDLTSVTVAAPSTMDADVWSTALMVLGTDAGEALARNQGVAAYFITETRSGFMSSWTPAMEPWMV
jgi:FAD:protein FMN transferase